MNDEWCYAIICRVFGHRHTRRSPIVMPGYFWCDRCQRWIFDCIIHDEETKMEAAKPMTPYQQRVVAEREDLVDKLDKLSEFLKGDVYRSLPADERERLARQYNIMVSYSNVLVERIIHF